MGYLRNCSMMFAELPLLERPAAAREAGFDAIETWWPFGVAAPPDTEVDASSQRSATRGSASSRSPCSGAT